MPELSTQMRPFIASTMRLQMYNPSPVPRIVPPVSRLSRMNFSKSLGNSSGGMPGPASLIDKHMAEEDSEGIVLM